MTYEDALDQGVRELLSEECSTPISWDVLLEHMKHWFKAAHEEEIRAAIERLVTAEVIELVDGHQDLWALVVPKPPTFVKEVAAYFGLKPLHSFENYNGDCVDHKVVLEPLIRANEGDPKKAREQAIADDDHVLIFRHLAHHGSDDWICLLRDGSRYYQQTEFNERSPLLVPQEALDGLIKELDEDIRLLRATRNLLVRARGQVGQ